MPDLNAAKAAALALAVTLTATSCDSLIYDDLAPCESGVRLRFVYDYNMEFANSFYSKVDDLAVYVYDEQGTFIKQISPAAHLIHDENYRLTLDLPEGTYHVVAYGGLEGANTSFVFDSDPSEVPMHERRLRLKATSRTGHTGISNESLKSLFYGALTVVVPKAQDSGYVDAKVEMMKNTNNFRIVLQQINGEPLCSDDFEYEIIDDNVLFSHDNSLLPTAGGVRYYPWAKGDYTIGSTSTGEEWVTTYAELSTSRLISRKPQSRAPQGIRPGSSSVSEPRMRVLRTETGDAIIDIPLINYLELYKSQLYDDMPVQEFFDRQSKWDIIFFLDSSQSWISTYIEVNGWVVRLNEIEM